MRLINPAVYTGGILTCLSLMLYECNCDLSIFLMHNYSDCVLASERCQSTTVQKTEAAAVLTFCLLLTANLLYKHCVG